MAITGFKAIAPCLLQKTAVRIGVSAVKQMRALVYVVAGRTNAVEEGAEPRWNERRKARGRWTALHFKITA